MNKDSVEVFPSIMAADVGKLYEEAKRIELCGADGIHVDVMDAHFVPNLAFSPQETAAIRRATPIFIEVHLMMYNPYDYIEAFVKAGANRVIFHFEATEDIEDTLSYIRRCNVQAGLAFCPETSESLIPRFLPYCDLVLLMTVKPGFGGQSFKKEIIPKIHYVRDMCKQMGICRNTAPFPIEVDGGIDQQTARLCIAAGANVLAAGSYLFGQQDFKGAIESLRRGAVR